MELFIANCTKQNMDFIYRLPGDNRMHMQRIPVGGQLRIYKDTTLDVIKHIISQHEKYGLVSADEVVKQRGWVGACWSFKPIDIERVVHAVDHNDGVIQENALEYRKGAAAAMADFLARENESLNNLEIEVEEVVPKGADPGYSEVIEVRDQSRPERGRRGRRNRQ